MLRLHIDARRCERSGYRGLVILMTALLPLAAMTPATAQVADPFGSPFNFAVLAGSTINNTGPTVITGNVGVSPGTAITGFPPGIIDGVMHISDAVAIQAQGDLAATYNTLAGLASGTGIVGDLGGRTLTSGVYGAAGSIGITGTLTLDGGGNPNAVFVFQIGNALTTTSNSEIVLINGANAANVYFQVGSSATLGTNTTFQGRILALTSIVLNTGASINCGAALARNGSVTLDTNIITACLRSATVTIADALGAAGSENAIAVGQAIDTYRDNGATLPISLESLSVLSPAALAAALERLSGEAATGVTPAAVQSMNSFLDMVMKGRRGPGVLTASGNDAAVSGYMAAPAPAGGSAFDSFEAAEAVAADWTTWISGYGGYNLTKGDAAIGSHDRTVRDLGLAAGFERHLDPYTMLGAAISKGGTAFSLSDGFGGGNSASVQAAIYGRAEMDDAYVSGVLAYGYHDVSTDRSLSFAGIDRFASNFVAHNIAGEVEVGRRFGLFTPYAGLRGQSVTTPAHGETTVAGNSFYALSYNEQTVLTGIAELGVRFDWTTDLEAGTLSLHSGLALVQTLGSNTNVGAAFQALPGSGFTVKGASANGAAVKLAAGLDLALDQGFSIGAAVEGQFSANSQSYSGTGHLRYRW